MKSGAGSGNTAKLAARASSARSPQTAGVYCRIILLGRSEVKLTARLVCVCGGVCGS